LAVRLPIPYNFSEQIAQKKAEQRKSSLRRAAIEDKIRIQVASNFESMRFWQDEVLERQAVYRDLKTRIETAGKTAAKTETSPLEALLAYEQTAAGYFEAILKNRIAKAELEWAIGQDLQ
ncbi:MAG: hypothetical protein J6C49_07820, partial [Elusimicrobiaceae bacterium]|nr:hypothetical protein [Elusimicrobiaceae bacterium]